MYTRRWAKFVTARVASMMSYFTSKRVTEVPTFVILENREFRIFFINGFAVFKTETFYGKKKEFPNEELCSFFCCFRFIIRKNAEQQFFFSSAIWLKKIRYTITRMSRSTKFSVRSLEMISKNSKNKLWTRLDNLKSISLIHKFLYLTHFQNKIPNFSCKIIFASLSPLE